MKERDFQPDLIKELKARYPGCLILKNDPHYQQGIPDLTILYKSKWAILECKKSEKASHRPNQDYFVDTLGEWSFASFIFPENKEEVLKKLDVIFEK